MQFSERFVEVHGARFRYLESDNARALPTLVCYHATGFVSELWLPIIRALGDGYHAIALDQRGHGGSDKSTPISWRQAMDDFQAFVRVLDLQHIIGLGHSSGATAIAATAAREPERVARAVLIEPTVRARMLTTMVPSLMIERTRKRRSRWADVDELKATLGARPPYNSWTAEMLELFARHATAPNAQGEIELRCTPEAEAQFYESFPTYDPWPDMLKVRIPLLVIHGTGPSVMPTTRVAELQPTWPQARFVPIAEGGHLVLMEAPDKVVAAMKPFLGERE